MQFTHKIASAISLALLSTQLQAQQNATNASSPSIERIQVTGSYIKRSQQEDATPLLHVDALSIAASGKTTLTDVLRDLTINSGNSFDEQFTGSFSAGSASIGLRGLSPKNTLLLVNGQRLANYGFALNTQDTFVDLNALPLSAVKRIEVLKDGASAVYGSDAIAGVVNILLHDDVDTTTLTVGHGAATQGGLTQYSLGFSTGVGQLAQDGYNLSLSADWLTRERLDASDRDLLAAGDFRHLPGGKLAGWSTQGANRLDQPAQPKPLANCPQGSSLRPWQDFTPGRAGQICAFNTQAYNTLQPEVTRRQWSFVGTVAITEQWQASVEWLFSNNDSAMQFGAPLTVGAGLRAYEPSNGTLVDIPVQLPVGHPDNPTQRPLAFEYTLFDVGPRYKANSQQFSRWLARLQYQGDVWQSQLQILESFSHQREYVANFVNRFAFTDALQSGSYRFDGRQNNVDVIHALRLTTRRPGEYNIRSLNGSVSRDLYHGDYGSYGVAAGVDLRQEQMDAGTSPQVLSGTELRPAINLVNGERQLSAGFVEFSLPLYQDFTTSLAGRLDHYDDFGSAFSPKIASHYVLADDWLLRASWSKGFRAPSLPEIADSTTISYGAVVDKFDPQEPGARRGYTQLRGGNTQLQPETSVNQNAGIVWSFSRDGSIGLDWYRIRQHNVISGDSAQFVVDNPQLFADRIVRDAQGRLQLLKNQYTNQGQRTTQGVDFDSSYQWQLRSGQRIQWQGVWSYLIDFEQALMSGQAPQQGAGNNLLGALPRLKSSQSVRWLTGDWQTSVTAQYTAGYQQKVATAASNPGLAARVASHVEWDAQLSYHGFADWQLRLSLHNVLDRDPPFDPSAGSDYTDTTQYHLRGREVLLSASYQF
jgi:iron complex outermembrane receptor protein